MRQPARLPFPAFAASALLPLLAACAAVGPDYAGAPANPGDSAHFARAPAEAAMPVLTAARWWEALGDAELDHLIRRALTDSPDLQAARARVEQARATLGQQQAATEPKLGASALGGVIEQAPGSSESRTLHGYTASLVASWELDPAGGLSRRIEAAEASRDASEAELADARLALAAETAQTYVKLRAAQARASLLQEDRQTADSALALVRQRRTQGVASEADVQQRIDQLAASQANFAQNETERLAALDRLALLCGQPPASLDAELATATPLPALPAQLAIGDPATMLRHRPDIRAAERRLASSTALIGAQRAAYFPKLSLYGGAGFFATEPGQVFRQENSSLFLVPFLSWDFLDFNRTTSAVHKAEASRDEALASYRSQVLRALNDANAALARFGQQKQELAQLETREASSTRQLELAGQLRKAGVASAIQLADAQRQQLAARSRLLDLRANLLASYILLQKSLGLGWQES